MRSVDERVAAVRRRSARLRRRQNDRALAVLACIMVLPLVGFAGKVAVGGLSAPPGSSGGLFGSASLFGSSAGGYVLVAVVAAAIAVAVTVLLMLRRKSRDMTNEDAASPMSNEEREGNGQFRSQETPGGEREGDGS